MKIPTEGELIEMERRARRILEQTKALRARIETLEITAETSSELWRRNKARQELNRLERWADEQERIEADFSILAEVVRELRPCQ